MTHPTIAGRDGKPTGAIGVLRERSEPLTPFVAEMVAMSENGSDDDSSAAEPDPIEEIASGGSGETTDESTDAGEGAGQASDDFDRSGTDSADGPSRSAGATADPPPVPDVDDRAIDAERDARDLVEAVADTGADAAAGVAALVERVAELEAERADLEGELESVESQLKRKQADFENYKKRAKREQERVKEQAAADLVERLLEVRDDLARALEDAGDDEETIQEGVRMTLSEFDRILDAEGVDRIDVEPGDRVDPEHHEVIARVDGDTEPGTIDEQHRPGYRMHGNVLREAQVTVTDEGG